MITFSQYLLHNSHTTNHSICYILIIEPITVVVAYFSGIIPQLTYQLITVSVGPHDAFYTHVTCEKSCLAQKLNVMSGIFMRLACWASSAANSCVFDLIGLLSFSEHISFISIHVLAFSELNKTVSYNLHFRFYNI